MKRLKGSLLGLLAFLLLAGAVLGLLGLLGCSSLDYPTYPASDHYDPQTRKFRNLQPQRAPIDNISGLWETFTRQRAGHPPQPLPEVPPDWALLQRGDKTRFVWFGHSSFWLHIGGQNLLVDPVFGPSVSPVPGLFKRFQPPLVTAQTLPPADVVLLSHNHFDHLEEATIKAYADKAGHFITPLGLGVQLQAWGIAADRITELDWWQSAERGGIRYTAVPARHDSARGLFDRFDQLWAGFVLERVGGGGAEAMPAERIYYSGDSGMGQLFADIAARFEGGFDLAFIENGQYNYRWPDNHLFPEEVAEVAALLKVRRLVPVHWGAYPMAMHSWNDPVLRLLPAAQARGLGLLVPQLGQVVDAGSEVPPWYLDGAPAGQP